MYNYNYDTWYQNMMRNFNSNNNMTGSFLFTPEVAYNNGNLFSNLYSQYKNYRPAQLSANTEKEKLLLDIGRLSFAAHDLNLYLDLNPNDESMLALFNDYRKQADSMISEYESKFGPLNISSNSLETGPFKWINSPWPWEVMK
ncbi:MAG: spore coat protein CotJB [Bacilli bacterium]|nr:spore coat protein CotJB [Mycoplasmatota bacterium]MDD6264378.1 spore coat protein CotJB [bacterium]MDY2697540.1 spore coat protein CotJB [Bacilli bacterium]MDD6941969.1 spore coat protein CotJB [bacterium]MDY5992742.1 spore coat protein CotJB [Bacilli bacterium]